LAPLHGQPTCFSAPEFAERRQALINRAGDGVILIDAALFPAEFFYLTGVQGRGARLLVIPESAAAKTSKPRLGDNLYPRQRHRTRRR
jgi:hypothetical protein